MSEMKRLTAVLLLFVLTLSGCSQAQQVENQAYVLAMGVDRTDSGNIKITVQTPKVSGSSDQGGSSGGDAESYFRFAAEGESFEHALERLEWIIPRRLNLSHLKLIVFSESISAEADCRRLIHSIVHTERLFSAARAVVCKGQAGDFIAEIQAVMGSRLSTDVTNTFEHYISQGFIPDSKLADLYYTTESVYSDPMAAYGFTSGDDPAQLTESEAKTHYLGAALFREGVFAGTLNGRETIFANLLSGTLKQFRYAHNGQGLELFPDGRIQLAFDTDAQPLQISLKVPLNVSAQEEVPDLEGLQAELEREILQTVTTAQRLGVEPFDFADHAARNFLTLDDWIAYNWRERFVAASVRVEVTLKRIGA